MKEEEKEASCCVSPAPARERLREGGGEREKVDEEGRVEVGRRAWEGSFGTVVAGSRRGSVSVRTGNVELGGAPRPAGEEEDEDGSE